MARLRTLVRRRNSVLGANIAARLRGSLVVGRDALGRTDDRAGRSRGLRAAAGASRLGRGRSLRRFARATTYFLAGPERRTTAALDAGRDGPRGRLARNGALGTRGAAFASHAVLPRLSLALILLAGLTVLTQLVVATAKSCSQGTDDLPGANRVIVNEEFLFLPAYARSGPSACTATRRRSGVCSSLTSSLRSSPRDGLPGEASSETPLDPPSTLLGASPATVCAPRSEAF